MKKGGFLNILVNEFKLTFRTWIRSDCDVLWFFIAETCCKSGGKRRVGLETIGDKRTGRNIQEHRRDPQGHKHNSAVVNKRLKIEQY